MIFSPSRSLRTDQFTYIYLLTWSSISSTAFFAPPISNGQLLPCDPHTKPTCYDLLERSKKSSVLYSKITPAWAVDDSELKNLAREAIDLVEGRFENVMEIGAQKLQVSDLIVGDYYLGTVKSVFDYGAFVDIGYSKEGLLHVSHLFDLKLVEDARQVLSEGQTIKVHILRINSEKGTYDLSAMRRDGKNFDELKNGLELEGTVTRIMSWGAFIDVGYEKDGLLHVTRIKDEIVKDTHDVLKIGQKMTAHVIHLDRKKRTFGLSMRSLEADRHLDYLHGDKRPRYHSKKN